MDLIRHPSPRALGLLPARRHIAPSLGPICSWPASASPIASVARLAIMPVARITEGLLFQQRGSGSPTPECRWPRSRARYRLSPR
jgi:hypothetical protein